MLTLPSYHALAAMAVTIAMFIAFARGRMSIEIISLLTIAVIAVGLYFFPLEGAKPIDGLALAFGGLLLSNAVVWWLSHALPDLTSLLARS
ncbi:MAG: hypothetical protein AAFQ90_03240, partial [Pseudomonadota bacterium]